MLTCKESLLIMDTSNNDFIDETPDKSIEEVTIENETTSNPGSEGKGMYLCPR